MHQKPTILFRRSFQFGWILARALTRALDERREKAMRAVGDGRFNEFSNRLGDEHAATETALGPRPPPMQYHEGSNHENTEGEIYQGICPGSMQAEHDL